MSGPFKNPHHPSTSVFLVENFWTVVGNFCTVVANCFWKFKHFGNIHSGFRDLQSFPFREGHSEPGPTGAP
jgi:hypothetical protein